MLKSVIPSQFLQTNMITHGSDQLQYLMCCLQTTSFLGSLPYDLLKIVPESFPQL